jgi:hypothetical protein
MSDIEYDEKKKADAARHNRAHWRTEKRVKKKRNVRGDWIAMIQGTDFLDMFPKADIQKLSDQYRTGGYRAVTLDPTGRTQPNASAGIQYATISFPLVIFSRQASYGLVTYTVNLRTSVLNSTNITASMQGSATEDLAVMIMSMRKFQAAFEKRIETLSHQLAQPGEHKAAMAELQVLWKLKLGMPF